MTIQMSATAPQPSALTSYINTNPASGSHLPFYHTLALQILHNLQYQHDWTDLRIHTHSPLTRSLLPRPLLSGLPPHRIYVHPDDQVEELKRGADPLKGEPEREWVLPTHLAEKWSLRRFGDVFDGIGGVPPTEAEEESVGKADVEHRWSRRERRGGKRVLLATLGDDSTVLYYIVHDGIVKPRQN